MRVTLIYPGITECGFNSLKGNEGSWMNHGLAILSSALKEKGHEVNLIDLRRLTGWEHYRQVVKDKVGAIVGVTMMSVDYDAAVTAAKIIKEIKPETKVFVGGPHASICPEELEPLQCIDCVVRGEGEITFPQMLKDIADGKNLPKVVEGRRLENLDESPWADRDLFDNPEEPFVPFLKPPFVTLIAGRGCRYNCNYCQPAERIMFGPKVRRRSADNVIQEMKYLYRRYRFNSFMIHDDCLTEDRQWVMDFCSQLKTEGFNQSFVAQSRADIICKNRDMVETLRDAGLKLFIIGFESGSDRVLKFLRKGCTRQQNLEAAHVCKELGIKIWANYMLGLPTETKEEVLETLSMLEQIKPYHCSPAFYTPHPGSDLFEIGKKMGIHLITNHDSYRRNTYEPKIKGPDYEFLKNILYKSIAQQEEVYDGISTIDKFKNKIKVILAGTPRLYRILKGFKRRCEKILVHIHKSRLSAGPTNLDVNLEECRKLPLIMKSKPLLVYAEISTYCNMNCRMCGRSFYDMTKETQGLMKREIFEKLTELFTQDGTLALFGRGETLLHPEFTYFLKLAKTHAMKVSFNSNGKALDEEISQAMVKYKQDSITFSCSAGTAETYEAIHRGGKWDQLWSNIVRLNEIKKLYGSGIRGTPAVYLEFVSQLDNIRELPLLIQRALEWDLSGVLVIDVVAHSPEMGKQRMNIPENLPIAEQYYAKAISVRDKLKKLNPDFDLRLPSVYNPLTKKFMDKSEIGTLKKLNRALGQKAGCGQNSKMCLEPWQTFYVRFDGKVAPCVITNRNLGDLNTQGALEIWNGIEFQKFRSRMRSEHKPFECLRCHLFPGPQVYDQSLNNAEVYEAL